MAKAITLDATARERLGKGASRAARRINQIPCVVYGDNKEPEAIQIPLNVIVRLINRGGFMSHTYALTVGKKVTTVLPRDLQLHPVTDVPMHIDFLRLGKGMSVVMAVPVRVIGEEECEGLTKGGVINHTRHDIELNVPADAIPEYIEVSVASLGLGDSVKISDVTLPKGATPTITDRDFTICAIVAPSALKSTGTEDEDEDAEGEEGETEETTEE
jgi:large subunit ribosomal protein L25